jgi:hypothetical protein
MSNHVGDKLLSHVMIQSAQNKDIIAKLARLEATFEQRMIKLENKVSEHDRLVASKPQALGQSQQPSRHVTGTYKPVGAEFTMINFEEYRRDNDR